MSKYRKHNRKPFGELSRKRKKAAYISVANRIRRAATALGGLFYTHDYLHGENGWIDGYFLSARTKTFYNFALQTTRYAYVEAVRDAAWDAADKLVPYDFDIIRHSERDPETGLYRLNFPVDNGSVAFGGLTRMAWIDGETRRLADLRETTVREEVTLHRDYAYGIGLHATIDVPALTVETVNAFIRRFLEQEAEWKGEPLSFTWDEAGYWGLQSNAIVEPWEHPPVAAADGAAADGAATDAAATESGAAADPAADSSCGCNHD